MESWFKIDAKAATPTVYIYDEIGLFGVTAADFARDLKALGDLKGKDLKLRLNTPGGDVLGGNAIMVLLRETGAKITVYIDGVAASMGSAIAMMGDKVIIAEGAFMMIHNPAGMAKGGSDDLRSTATLLDAIKEGMVTAYARKSGLGRDVIAKMMDDETWMDAEQAVAAGFADEIGEVVKAIAAYDLSRYSRNPPHVEANKEADMALTKEDIEALGASIGGAVTAANKPVLDAIAALKPEAKTGKEGTEPKVKTEAEIRAEITAESTALSAEITELCALVGMPTASAGYIAAGKTVAEVKADLKAKVAAKGKKSINNSSGGALEGNEDNTDEDISDLIPKARSGTEIWAQFNGKRGVAH